VVLCAVDDFFFLTVSSAVSDWCAPPELDTVVAGWALDVDAPDVDSAGFESVSAPDDCSAVAEPVSDVVDEVSDSVGDAHANPAGAAIAVPMPRATANAPTRPMYLPCPDLVHVMATAPFRR
jgi:hypothetical protein